MWVSPTEIEDVLGCHAGVGKAAVVGIPAHDVTFEVIAFVVLRKVTKPQEEIIRELHELSTSLLPRYKRPKKIRVISELPRNPTGRVQRFKLRTERGVFYP